MSSRAGPSCSPLPPLIPLLIPLLRAAFALLLFLAPAACERAHPDPTTPTTPATPPPTITLQVACAANMQAAFPALEQAWIAAHPQWNLAPVFGSSGTFHTQLAHDAPFDLFLSADLKYPQALVDAQLTLALHAGLKPTITPYAQGTLVLWSRTDGIRVDELKERSFAEPSIRHIAIANPALAPYGRAAESALRSLNQWNPAIIVMGDNVEQAASFARTGAADLALIAKSLALAPAMKDEGRMWELPQSLYDPIVQGAVAMKTTTHSEAVQAFLDFLTSPVAQDILRAHGFTAPPGAP